MADETPAIYAFLAERAGKPAGVIVFFMTYSTWYGAPGVYVQDLFVAKASRGEGVGKLLLAAAARWSAARGATHLKLSVDADNQPAQAFYESTGFTHRDDELMYMIGGTEFLELAVEP